MPIQAPYIFISYARADHNVVSAIIDELEARGIKTWVDTKDLRPGDNWNQSIYEALKNAAGMIIFISPASMKSDYIREEIAAAARGAQEFIIPVILEHVPDLPPSLAIYQWLDLSDANFGNIPGAAERLANIVKTYIASGSVTSPNIRKEVAGGIAESMAQEKRGGGSTSNAGPAEPPNSVFIVHGRDVTLLADIENHISHLGINPIVLTKIFGAEKSLFEKFLTWSADARFAIVLISADDLGASRHQYDEPGVGDRALQFRARQNVILELGFFYGYLGWENVFVMFKQPDKVFPNFEFPSDLSGVVYDSVDASGAWKKTLEERLSKAGFIIK